MTLFSNKRVVRILEILIDSQKSISGERISVELGVTSRTVRSDIKELNKHLNNNGARIISVTGVGYSLEIEDESKFNYLLKDVNLVKQGNGEQLNIIPTYSEDRINYIISKLLMSSLKDKNKLINPYDLCDELFISSSTLKKDVASINTHLARFNLKVVINQSKGIFIKGKESNIRYLHDFDKTMLDNSDVVITTVPITKFQSNKIIEVPLNLGFKHLQEIEDIMLGEEKIEMDYKEILKEDLFFKQLKANTKDEVLEILTNRMIGLGYMDEKVKKSVYSREKMATTELGNLVALPHVLELNGNNASVSLAVLDKPIIWDKEKVQIVLLLNISKEFINEWEQIFKNLYNYLIVKSGVNKLIKGISYSEFINDLIAKLVFHR